MWKYSISKSSAPKAQGKADAYGHHVWKMIRKSEGRTKPTSAMFGVRFLGAPIMHLSPTKEKGNAMIATWCKNGAVLFVCWCARHGSRAGAPEGYPRVTARSSMRRPSTGHLPELKGKGKMRITENTIAPGGACGRPQSPGAGAYAG